VIFLWALTGVAAVTPVIAADWWQSKALPKAAS
jgi:hypothetical protein